MPIVEAVGTSAGRGLSRDSSLAARIEKAMTHAVLDALADGVSMDDSVEILRRKQMARQAVLDDREAKG